jgi:hypothetical protein
MCPRQFQGSPKTVYFQVLKFQADAATCGTAELRGSRQLRFHLQRYLEGDMKLEIELERPDGTFDNGAEGEVRSSPTAAERSGVVVGFRSTPPDPTTPWWFLPLHIVVVKSGAGISGRQSRTSSSR